jgi:site-specific recombinase XerD
MRILEAIEYYINNCTNSNLSGGTINQYKKELEKFNLFLKKELFGEKDNMENIKSFHIDRYLSESIKDGNMTNTRVRKKSILDSFFKFCMIQEIIEKNQMSKISKIKLKDVDQKKKETLNIKEYIRLVKKAELGLHGSRNRIIIKIATFGGLRVSEINALKWTDIDFQEKKINIKGKGGKIRSVPLFEEVEMELLEYKKINKEQFLFPGRDKTKSLTARAILKMVKENSKKARIEKIVGCHTLRRTAATIFLKEGVNIRYIQLFLGHKDISTTMRYMNPEEKEITDKFTEAFKGINKQISNNNKKKKGV